MADRCRTRAVAVGCLTAPLIVWFGGCTAAAAQAQDAGTATDLAQPKDRGLVVKVLGGTGRQPVAGAKVRVSNPDSDEELAATKANNAGLAVLQGLPLSAVKLQVTAFGWRPHGRVVDLGNPELPSEIEIVLEERSDPPDAGS